jgi:hypothetical protein
MEKILELQTNKCKRRNTAFEPTQTYDAVKFATSGQASALKLRRSWCVLVVFPFIVGAEDHNFCLIMNNYSYLSIHYLCDIHAH